jgi:putative transposase
MKMGAHENVCPFLALSLLCSANTTSGPSIGDGRVFRRAEQSDQRRREGILAHVPPPPFTVLHGPPPPVRCRHVCPTGGDVSAQLAAENLFLRKQLALYQERRMTPRRPDPATRVILVLLSRMVGWRSLLTVVQPETLIRWHRQGWRLLWWWKSRPGRPPIPGDLQRLIVTIAQSNPTWGEERIANELRLKLGLTVSPRTVGRYLRGLRARPRGRRSQRWATFVRNHAHAVVACDFFTTVTARFRLLYVFVVLEVGTRRILHWNVTEHPTAEWTIQQFRTVITPESSHRFVLHDRDSIFAAAVDRAIVSMGRHVLKTPVRTPQANAFCERLIGTMRRECLDWLLPLHEGHLRSILRE